MLELKEKILNQTSEEIKQMPINEVHDLIKKMQLYQVELQMQNEELRRTQYNLDESHDRYFDLYNFAPAGYITTNSNGVIIDCNMTTSTLLDMKISTIVGRNMLDIITAVDHDIYSLHIQNLIKSKVRQDCVIKMLKSDGAVIYARMESDIALDNQGNTNYSSVFLDVSKCKLAEQSLEKTIVALTKSNTQLERFAYVASHDLREPLRNISSCVQLLDMKYSGSLDSEGKKLITYTVESVQQINSLVSDLLAYSQNGRGSGRVEVMDCNLILEHVLENLKQLISENHAKITFGKLPEIIADKTQIVQLLQNLISNAVKHNDSDDIQIHIAASQSENNWLFSVKDNGPGIDNEYLQEIFEIFKKLDHRNKYNGTGIGLAICKQVVTNHGGNIWVESEVGKGSVFYFTLPSALA